jgi:arsenite methyltransferase
VAGALAERVFAHKLERVGFTDLEVIDRRPFGLQDAARYPLFTPELIELMHDLLPPDRRDEVAVAVTLTARRPQEDPR